MNQKEKNKAALYAKVLVFIALFPAWAFAQQEKLPIIETETGFYYVVQEGDTLWDLSQRFSDSPWKWPDLWSQNEQITNPHLIYPGQRIRLYRRKDIEKLEKSPPEMEPYYETSGGPPVYRPMAGKVFTYTPIESIGFIRKQAVDPDGAIMEVADNKELINDYDIVFIKHMSRQSFTPGEKYFIYETISPVVHPVTGEKLGTKHLFTGVLEITRSELKFSEARVVKAYRTIRVGHFLMPFERKEAEIPVVESVQGLYGSIVSSEKMTNLFGDDTIVFIDKGEADGVAPGQFYSVYKRDTILYDETTRERVLLTPIMLGSIFVLHTEETTSTVLIDRVESGGVPLGSTFGTPVP